MRVSQCNCVRAHSSAVTSIIHFSVSLLLLLAPVCLFAQANLGRISGTVRDQSGGAVVGVAVSVVDADRGAERNAPAQSPDRPRRCPYRSRSTQGVLRRKEGACRGSPEGTRRGAVRRRETRPITQVNALSKPVLFLKNGFLPPADEHPQPQTARAAATLQKPGFWEETGF